jgi:plasmid stabilization system protein ParE
VWPVRFTPAARVDLIDAQDWYEGESTGLGHRFRAEIDRAMQNMASNPRQFPVVFKNVHRARLKIFPYALFFVIHSDMLLVIACFHSSRDPQHWQQRA